MYKDIISYELSEDFTEERLLKVAQDIIENWMVKLNGFIKWEITKTADGKFMDIVHWESKEAAKAAEGEMRNIPNAAEWMSCYKPGSISAQNVNVLFSS